MTESTSEYKKRIEEIKQSIENEPYMAKMREDIAEGISKTGIRQATVEEQFQSVLDETTGKDVISAPEVILARGGARTLGERLYSEKAEVSAQLAQKADEANVRKKSELIGLNDAASDLLQAISDAPGTPININSVPKDGSVTVKKTSFVNSGENLFDKNADDNVEGKMILANGTETIYANGIIATIEVNPNDVITGYFNPTTFAVNAKAQIYNSEGVKIETLTPVFSGEIGSVKIPDNALIHHMKVNIKDVNLSTAMFVKGSIYPSKYIPFDYMLDETFTLNKKQAEAVVKIQKGILNPNPLDGKTIIFDGDSIMNAINDAQDGWAGRMATKNNMIYTNYAVDGATITAGIMAGSNPRHWVSRSVDGYRSDADIIVVEGGANDADLIGVSNMGEISVGFDAVLDDTVFTGAVESTLKQLILKYPDKKIVFIIAHRMGSIDQQNVRRAFFDRIIECCEKWGIPYLDIWKNSYLNSDIPSIKEKYFIDKQHLKTAGYDLTFPMVEHFLKKP